MGLKQGFWHYPALSLPAMQATHLLKTQNPKHINRIVLQGISVARSGVVSSD